MATLAKKLTNGMAMKPMTTTAMKLFIAVAMKPPIAIGVDCSYTTAQYGNGYISYYDSPASWLNYYRNDHNRVLYLMRIINPDGITHLYKQSNQLPGSMGCIPQLMVHMNRITPVTHTLGKRQHDQGSNSEDQVSVEVPQMSAE